MTSWTSWGHLGSRHVFSKLPISCISVKTDVLWLKWIHATLGHRSSEKVDLPRSRGYNHLISVFLLESCSQCIERVKVVKLNHPDKILKYIKSWKRWILHIALPRIFSLLGLHWLFKRFLFCYLKYSDYCTHSVEMISTRQVSENYIKIKKGKIPLIACVLK